MTKSKKFIITENKSISDELIANGFLLLSNSGGVYTFINQTKCKFNFSSIDTTKIHFTDKLCLWSPPGVYIL